MKKDYTVDMREPGGFYFGPMSEAEEVIQNLRTILSLPAGSAPFARSMGIPFEELDEPMPVAKARMGGSVMTAILEQEPRALVEEIRFYEDETSGSAGRLIPVVRFRLREG
ncbi:GPW/gp25 family protein [Paenibacillus chitinolyticus]|uniref:GPW/gp25 family protein n=1 Tax=Paenibacillus chitinolyticus TaxID=79263 RepID=UPI00210D3D47|nr:GPW/gp25 family protein [Paenibacillus chitinolyticus]